MFTQLEYKYCTEILKYGIHNEFAIFYFKNMYYKIYSEKLSFYSTRNYYKMTELIYPRSTKYFLNIYQMSKTLW